MWVARLSPAGAAAAARRNQIRESIQTRNRLVQQALAAVLCVSCVAARRYPISSAD
jgi:hypothetical protein